MVAKSCTSWYTVNIPIFKGFQHVSTILLVVQDFAGHPQYHYQSNLPFSNTCHGKDGHMPLIGHRSSHSSTFAGQYPSVADLRISGEKTCEEYLAFPLFLWMSEDFWGSSNNTPIPFVNFGHALRLAFEAVGWILKPKWSSESTASCFNARRSCCARRFMKAAPPFLRFIYCHGEPEVQGIDDHRCGGAVWVLYLTSHVRTEIQVLQWKHVETYRLSIAAGNLSVSNANDHPVACLAWWHLCQLLLVG